ncbi:PAS domain S-box protein [Aetokthonos hydrillicola Thurmond2011]|jgi:PAS domain S-box-containing protein|uniref:histidine kinase n=1 Tax=Aetokthonos hydrillicola Thurmond2011 TaxID=2712845 RepID=A0AAP5IE65_9CYAN|nr:PAS domain S-box protein [Aetokthonos hydrillicola]MBO3458010.1 PAS domain S-box protein [Aetokthonos hydrillicola CCALA 1050]MBW4587155.1 PAS domain S-box protein [Aetokthonos hydrillicola CCALA 1050]MDR9899594.1 PAS domain S-box protein [Aetokthonos hydrillicola Thurmond2011]
MAINKTQEELIAEVEALRKEVKALKQLGCSHFSVAVDEVTASLNSAKEQEYTILVLEDSEEDRAVYRRFLTQNNHSIYKIIEFDKGEDALVFCQQTRPDILLIDFFLPDMNGLEFFEQLYQQADLPKIPAIMITGQGKTEIVIDVFKKGAHDFIDKNKITPDSLNQAIAKVLFQQQSIKQQVRQQQQQQLVMRTALSIRRFLKLDDILQTAVTEIRQILQSDRVIIYQFQSDWSGIVSTESVVDPALSILGRTIQDDCFKTTLVEQYRQGRIRTIDDIYTATDLQQCHCELLASLQIRANLVIPIIQNDDLWGLLIAHQCYAQRHWTKAECELMNQLAIQMGIALQQAILFEKLQIQLLQHQKLVSIVENSCDFIATANVNGQILYINQAGRHLLGLENTQVQYTAIWEYQTLEFQQTLQQDIIPTAISTGRWEGEFDIQHVQTREFIAVWCNVFTLKDSKTGQPDTIVTVLRDIRQRKQAKEALRKLNNELELRILERTGQLTQVNNQLQQELLQREKLERELREREKLLDNFFHAASQVNIGLGIADKNFCFLKVNQALADINGHSIKEHNGQSVAEIIPELAPTILPLFQSVIDTHEPISNMEISVMVPTRPRAISHWLISYFPILGESADSINLGFIVLEISERKQIEAELRESDRRWRSLLDNIDLIVIGLDDKGYVEYANPFFLRLTGYTEAEVLGKNWFKDFIPRSEELLIKADFQHLSEQNINPHYQNLIVTKSGEKRMIKWNNTILQDIDGHPIGTLSIGEDITEHYKLERMKAEFVAIVSHELRTPLTSMQASLSLLHGKIIDPTSPEGEATIEIAADGVDRLVRLVNDILSLERLESGKIALEKRFCSTADLINTAITQIQGMATQAGIHINTTDADNKEFKIYADPDRLLQVLINLLSNAIKFSPPGSTIWLNLDFHTESSSREIICPFNLYTCDITCPDESFLIFSIKDQGRGIPQNCLSSIFEPFAQVDASDSRHLGGTGLGLAISRSIVHQHGGTIWADSILGIGSTFYFTLPVGNICNDY